MKVQFWLIISLVMILILSAFVPVQEVPQGEPLEFFEGFTSQALMGLVIGWIVGVTQAIWPKMSVFEWFKHKTGLEDVKAHYAILAITLVFSALALWVTGEVGLAGFNLTLKNLIALGAAIYAGSQTAYQSIKAKPELPEI